MKLKRKIDKNYQVDISLDKLKKLYLNRGLSEYEIAKIFSCHQMTISRRLREYGIPTRTICEAAVNRAKHFYGKKLKNFSGNLEEKSYLIGFRLGDIHVRQSGENTASPVVVVRTNSTKIEEIQLFRKMFSKYGYIWQGNKDKSGAISIRCYLNFTFSFLIPKADDIENWMLNNQKYFSAFLAGYLDAEGTFIVCRGDGVFALRSQDKNIIWQIYFNLNKLGVLCKQPKMVRSAGDTDCRGIKNNKDVWCLMIYRKDALLKLIEIIDPYLKHSKRYKDMKIVKANIEMRNKKYNNMPDRRWYKTYFITQDNYVRP